jgi:hypothetical protein
MFCGIMASRNLRGGNMSKSIVSDDVSERLAVTQQSINDSKGKLAAELIKALCGQMSKNPKICKECRKEIDRMVAQILAVVKSL